MDYGLIRVIFNILSFVVVIIVAIAGYIAFQRITKNHLHHLDTDLKEVKVEVKSNAENIVKIDKNIAIIATKLECKLDEK